MLVRSKTKGKVQSKTVFMAKIFILPKKLLMFCQASDWAVAIASRILSNMLSKSAIAAVWSIWPSSSLKSNKQHWPLINNKLWNADSFQNSKLRNNSLNCNYRKSLQINSYPFPFLICTRKKSLLSTNNLTFLMYA